MTGPAFVEQLKAKFGDKIAGANLENLDPWIEVTPDGLLEVCRYLRDEPTLAFDYLNCISGVDYLHTDEKKAAKSEWQPHMEVVYHLFSMKHKHSLVLKVILPRWKDDKPGELPEVPSRVRPVEHGRLARARGVRPVGHRTSRAIRICGAFSARKIGSAIRCAKITRCRSSITGFAADSRRRMSTAVEDPRIIEFDVRTDEMLVNMGPQHPSTHGVLRLVLRTDGEVVSEVTPHIGYLHRCAEKIGENLTPRQWIPYTDRMDYLAGMNMNLGWSLCVEKLLGYRRAGEGPAPAGADLRAEPDRQPPGRHGGATGSTWARSARSCTPSASGKRFSTCSRRRAAPGSPTATSRPAARRPTCRRGWLQKCEAFLDQFEPVIDEYHTLLTTQRDLRQADGRHRRSVARDGDRLRHAAARCSAAAASITTCAATAKRSTRRCTTATRSR